MSKFNKYITKFIICLIIIVFLFRLTVFSWPIRDAEIKQNILLYVTFLLWIPFIWNLLHTKKIELITVLKENWIIILYFSIRLLGILLNRYNLDRGVLESLYYEFFGLVVIGYYSLKKVDNLDFVFKIYIFANLILNLLTVLIYILMPLGLIDRLHILKNWILNSTAYNSFPYSSLYSNPNGAGIITGMAIVLGFVVFKKKKFLFWMYTAFSLWFVYFQRCRSAQVALCVCFFGILLVNIIKAINARTFSSLLLISCVIFVTALGGFILQNSSIDKIDSLNKAEQKLNQCSSGRYIVWKYDINANQKNLLLGSGSIDKGLSERKGLFLKAYKNKEIANQKVEELRNLDFHNGYIATFVVNGAIGFFSFILILLNKIKRLDITQKNYIYLSVCFIFIINLFECNFLVATYVYSILMMLALNIGRIKRTNYREKGS